MTPKLTYNEVLQRLNEDRSVDKWRVRKSALRQIVWLSEWHIPGCCSESRCFSTTKVDAIQAALAFADGCGKDGFGYPRGMLISLKRYGVAHTTSPLFGPVVTTVSRHRLEDLL